ncbi:sodium-dependent transporter [Tumebacillus avium]|uniref:Transporter n=1 Tax=Tumebacillus avium TaxID=1903704 RepID=A0A1Y0IU80_9BACL|nr:sodium-dependent transporter [Tumebacillus avium]
MVLVFIREGKCVKIETNQNSLQLEPKASDSFTSTGFILAAIGSSVGLGNMWKFPYITGMYGGAAFFLIFILCLALVGLPILLAEMVIGRGGRGNAVSSFHNLSKTKWWGYFGFLSVLSAFAIMGFYAVVAGWTMNYAFTSLTGNLFENPDYTASFLSFAGGNMPIFWTIITLIITCWVVAKGVAGGIEKFNKVLIPGLAVILVILMIRALTLPGAGEGVEFFLMPDFSKLTAESALVALGHAFFSLSLGMGAMLTYGAYTSKKQSLGKAAAAVAGGDLLYAFVAGLIIFPTVFSYGIAPGQGPGLAFMALPAAFAAMPLGNLFGFLFFFLLSIAALTSTVSLVEVPNAYLMERFKWSRAKSATIVTLIIFAISIPASMSMGILSDNLLFGKTFFDLLDFVASNIFLPIGGLVVTLFTGYAWKRAGEEAGLSGFWYNAWMFCLKYIAPIMVIVIFLYSIGIIKF